VLVELGPIPGRQRREEDKPMQTETTNRAASELVSEAIDRIGLYQQGRDRSHLLVAQSKLDQAIKQDQQDLKALFYFGVVSDLIGRISQAIETFRTILAEVPEGQTAVRDQVHYNLAVSLYHRYSRRSLELAEREFCSVVKNSKDPLLRCLARAGLAQTYAMWEIPADPVVRDAKEDDLLEERFKQARAMAGKALRQLKALEGLPEGTRRQIQGTVQNARGMARMYYTDYREARRVQRLRQALAELHEADEFIPLDWANTCDLASCHMRLGYWLDSHTDFEACRRYLTQVVESLRPGYGFALYETGRSYRLQGRFREALQFLALALTVPAAERDVRDERIAREVRLAEASRSDYP
jgi:tetratricopeptide (TPR) repeat protein